MLTIYGVYRSRASRNFWLARELGLDVRHVPVMQAYRPHAATAALTTRSPEFLRINPGGQIPALDDDGFVLTESLAINLYLAKKHGGPLAPADLREDAQMTRWSIWAATADMTAVQILYHRVSNPPAERDPAVAAKAIEALRMPFAALEAALVQGGGWLVGGRFTVADINVAEVVRYAMAAPELLEAAPRLKAWLAACHARPAFKDMMAARDREPA